MAIMRCNNPKCINRWMDRQYGEGKRVFNPGAKPSSGSRKYTCAGCGDIRTVNESSKEKEE